MLVTDNYSLATDGFKANRHFEKKKLMTGKTVLFCSKLNYFHASKKM